MKYTSYMRVTNLAGIRLVVQGSYIDHGHHIQMVATGEILKTGW